MVRAHWGLLLKPLILKGLRRLMAELLSVARRLFSKGLKKVLRPFILRADDLDKPTPNRADSPSPSCLPPALRSVPVVKDVALRRGCPDVASSRHR